MPRHRVHDKHLPPCVYLRSGSYYLVIDGRWLSLGKDYAEAMGRYAALAGRKHSITTVADAISHYLSTCTTRRNPVSKATLAGYQHSAKRLLRVFGGMSLASVKAADVYRYLAEHGTVGANRDKALLSAAYSEARVVGAFDGIDPTKRLQRRNPERARTRYVTDAELDRLCTHAQPKMAAMVRVSYLMGLRLSDVIGIRWQDVTAEGVAYRASKTGKRTVVVWSDALREVFTDARRLGRKEAVLVFESRPRHLAKGWTPYTPSGVKAMWRRVKLKAGLGDVVFHDLRRKAGSDTDIDHASALLQHSDPRVTHKHYRAKPERVRPTR